MDYVHQNVYGTWDQIKNHPIISTYPGLEKLDFSDTFFALNVQIHDSKKIPTDKFKKIVISYHTEYFEHQLLWDFFQQNQDCNFLFLSDTAPVDIWPSNVTMYQWITWGEQLDVAIEHHNIATELTAPKYKISSLSNRHEFHKAAVTAFLLETFDKNDMVLSWNNWCPKEPYYKTAGAFVPPEIQEYLQGSFKSLDSIKLDSFENSPVANGNWNHPAYLYCAINLTNESVFNCRAKIGETRIKLPTPYLTEKTWKPLIAGRPFIPVGQAETLQSLSKLGLQFDYDLDLSFDTDVEDFDRIRKIYSCLRQVYMFEANEIFNRTKESTKHNLEHIRSGKFREQCNIVNLETLEKIYNW